MRIIYPWSAIAAMGPNRGIGHKGKLPWNLPDELKWFRQKTLGQTIVMGRNTWDSIGQRALPGRLNVVVSSTLVPSDLPEGVRLIHSLDELQSFTPQGSIMIIGGKILYEKALPYCKNLFLTYIKGDYPADTFFPEFEPYFDQGEEVMDHQDFTVRHHKAV
jgi:dihydrofolate reductase